MDPHRDQHEQPDAGASNRGPVIAAVVIGAIFLVFVVLHLAGAMALHVS